MFYGKTLARVALACAVLMGAPACTPMLRAAEATKMLNPNKWGGPRCGNCVESVAFNPESPDGAE